ncbi:acyltransferase family protein [Paenibacillus sp. CC-CFT747]|nr:acyltransferase family protein [Paenibacillus sp. CC-CFT747]
MTSRTPSPAAKQPGFLRLFRFSLPPSPFRKKTGYAFYLIMDKAPKGMTRQNLTRIFKLYLNYWAIMAIFVPLGFLFGYGEPFTGGMARFLLDFIGWNNSYNGAWWFLRVYVIIVLASPFLIKLVKKIHPVVLLLLSGAVYFVSYLQKVKGIIQIGGEADHVLLLVALLGITQLSFFVGAAFAKYSLYSRLYAQLGSIRFKNTLCVFGICLLVVFHSIIESAIIAPINGIAFICLFLLMNKSKG